MSKYFYWVFLLLFMFYCFVEHDYKKEPVTLNLYEVSIGSAVAILIYELSGKGKKDKRNDEDDSPPFNLI